jgi:hypothetical protein
MRTINIFFAAVVMLFICSCGSKSGSTSDKLTFSTAVEYNDFIIALQKGIKSKFDALQQEFGNANLEGIKRIQGELANECKSAIDTLNKLDAYEGNTAFRDAAIQLFTHYKDYSGAGLKEQIEIVSKNELSPEDQNRLNQIDDEFAKKEEGLYNTLVEAQSTFAADNNMTINPN